MAGYRAGRYLLVGWVDSELVVVPTMVAQRGLQMSTFTAQLDNQPGKLARLSEARASSGVDVVLCATALDGSSRH
jgi:hypothetical protein